jgi:hypothetical protein
VVADGDRRQARRDPDDQDREVHPGAVAAEIGGAAQQVRGQQLGCGRHIFVLYLPKHVESCFLPGQTTAVDGGQFCTINHQPTAAFCAYHSEDPASAVYANMPFPIYASPVGFTCGTDARFPVNESPNGNVDADVEISPSSHEMNEAITDPDTETGWYDSTGNENGDDCAYIFGRTRGAPGAFFNQVINGGKFIIQEEFSNNLFASSGGTAGCLQSA